MWPFKKKQKPEMVPIPLNSDIGDPERISLPRHGADDDEIYAIASRLSEVRNLVRIPNDGIYCPICHIANASPNRQGTPCPRCERQLLKFGRG